MDSEPDKGDHIKVPLQVPSLFSTMSVLSTTFLYEEYLEGMVTALSVKLKKAVYPLLKSLVNTFSLVESFVPKNASGLCKGFPRSTLFSGNKGRGAGLVSCTSFPNSVRPT